MAQRVSFLNHCHIQSSGRSNVSEGVPAIYSIKSLCIEYDTQPNIFNVVFHQSVWCVFTHSAPLTKLFEIVMR